MDCSMKKVGFSGGLFIFFFLRERLKFHFKILVSIFLHYVQAKQCLLDNHTAQPPLWSTTVLAVPSGLPGVRAIFHTLYSLLWPLYTSSLSSTLSSVHSMAVSTTVYPIYVLLFCTFFIFLLGSLSSCSCLMLLTLLIISNLSSLL